MIFINLTTQELIILLVIIIAIGVCLSFVFRSFVRLIASVCLICILYFVGFTWLPAQMQQWKDGTKTPEDSVNEVISKVESTGVIDTTKDVLDKSSSYIDENKDSWYESLMSLLNKLAGNGSEEQPSEPEQPSETEAPVESPDPGTNG